MWGWPRVHTARETGFWHASRVSGHNGANQAYKWPPSISRAAAKAREKLRGVLNKWESNDAQRPAQIYISISRAELKATHCEGERMLLFFFQCILPTFATEGTDCEHSIFPSVFAEWANERATPQTLESYSLFRLYYFCGDTNLFIILASFSSFFGFNIRFSPFLWHIIQFRASAVVCMLHGNLWGRFIFIVHSSLT